ncbi:MAG TPA: DNA-deoxyinosine glycosylase [Sphingomicrobium sp.]|nr:DNA-deoxyinosine glycosylase [Sphingomicrobium sp.]
MASVKIGLPPIAPVDARLFILGSLPGDASLAARRYYAHPTNQFWRLVGDVLGERLQSLDYEQRLERLAMNRIGLWDVVASAAREGSLDQAIRSAEHNLIDRLLGDYPELRAIAFNGSMASAIGRRLVAADYRLTLIDLPSSSAANTRPFSEKTQIWRELAHYCGSTSLRRA